MAIYRVQMMTHEAYSNYMRGGYNYCVNEELIQAETSEKAFALAEKMFPNMVVNDYVLSLEEIKAKEQKRREEIQAREEAAARAKAKRNATIEAKATKMGLTLEEYKNYQNALRNKTRYMNEIAELEKELQKKKKNLAKYERELKKYI